MLETLSYPLIPGKQGFALNPDLKNDFVQTESGHTLLVTHTNSRIDIDSRPDTKYHMWAKVDGPIMGLGLQTVVDGVHHPDLFAADFVAYALGYFDSLNKAPQYLKGLWYPYSDNYKAFVGATEKGLRLETAAKQTWTGKQAEKHGFTKVGTITDNRLLKDHPHVKVIFTK